MVMPIVIWLLGILVVGSLIMIIFSWGNNTRTRTTSIYTFFAGLVGFVAAKGYQIEDPDATSLYTVQDEDVQLYYDMFDYLIIILITGAFGWVMFKLLKRDNILTSVSALLVIIVIGAIYFSFRNY